MWFSSDDIKYYTSPFLIQQYPRYSFAKSYFVVRRSGINTPNAELQSSLTHRMRPIPQISFEIFSDIRLAFTFTAKRLLDHCFQIGHIDLVKLLSFGHH